MKVFCPIYQDECPEKDTKAENQVFIIMAYKGEHSEEIKNMLLVSTQEAFNLKPILASEVRQHPNRDMFCNRICLQVHIARLCIADITYDNTNVGLEIGLAMMFGKPIILTLHKKWREKAIGGRITFSILPGDFAGKYVITYDNSKELTEKLKEKIEIQKILEEPRFGCGYPVEFYVYRKGSDEDMLQDMMKYHTVIFLGISQNNLKTYLRTFLEKIGDQMVPFSEIRIYYASEDDGRMWEGENFTINIKQTRQDIAALLTDPAWRHRIQNLERYAFFQSQHHSTFGGCMMENGEKIRGVTYVVEYLPTPNPDTKDSITFKIERERSMPESVRELAKSYSEAYKNIADRAKHLGEFELSLWDLSAREWANFSSNCQAYRRSMEYLVKFGNLKEKPNARIIDLGAGSGHTSKILLEAMPSCQLTLVDASPQMIRASKKVLGNKALYALCKVPSAPNEVVIDLEDKYDVIVIHLALPAIASTEGELQQVAKWCKGYLKSRGNVILAIHNTAVEIKSSTHRIERDYLRRAFYGVILNLDLGRYYWQRERKKLSQTDVKAAFTREGYICEKNSEAGFEMTIHDRMKMWRAPAVLNDIIDVRKLDREEMFDSCKDRLIDGVHEKVKGQPTPNMIVKYWSFRLKKD